MEFIYPKKVLGQVDGINSLNAHLRAQTRLCQLPSKYFRVSIQKGIYLYARCVKCKASLNYVKQNNQNFYVLKEADTTHNHRQYNKTLAIESFIRSLPSTMPTNFKKKLTQKEFKIKQSKFYYHNGKIDNVAKDFQQTLEWLDRNKFQIKYLPFPLKNPSQIPNILICSSPLMLSAFQRYGRRITFDLTYNVIKETQELFLNGNLIRRKWALGFFLGQDQLNGPIPLSIVLINSETTQNMEAVFLSFFEIVKAKHNYPQSIITDGQIAIASALTKIKNDGVWLGQHLIDTFHYLKTIRKNISEEPVFEFLRNAVMSFYPEQHQTYIEKAKQQVKTSSSAQVISKFINQRVRTCQSQTHGSFFGLGMSSSIHEKMNDHLKKYFREQKNASYVLQKTAEIFDELLKQDKNIKFCKVEYETVFENSNIKLLRYSLCQSVFLRFMKQYVSSLTLEIKKVSDFKWKIQNEIVTQLRQNQRVECSCMFYSRTGLPCKHSLRIINNLKKSFILNVDNVWKVNRLFQNTQILKEVKQFVRKGRPRLSRRNMIR